MTLDQVLNRKGRSVHAIRPAAPVIEAIRLMAENHIGALLVMESDRLVGILSERDYARKVVLRGRSSATTAVKEIMTAQAITATPESSVEDAMREMTEHRIRHLPVVKNDQVLGVVSIGDLVKCVIDDQRHLIEDLEHYIRG
jgi:CBS domain-containing protein